MFPYLLCFCLTGLFSKVNEEYIRRDRKTAIFITAVIVILIPAIFAGVRDYTIGTDTNSYIRPMFERIHETVSLSDYLNLAQNNKTLQSLDIGYNFFNFLISRISSSPHFFMFCAAAFIGIFTYISLYLLRNTCSIFAGEMIFLLTQYNASFNMVRQSMAMSMCLLAAALLTKKVSYKYIKFAIVVVLAMQFHSSAIIAFAYLIPYWLFEKNDLDLTLFFKIALFIILVTAVVAGISYVTRFFVNIGVLGSKYSDYFDAGLSITTRYSMIGKIIYVFPIIYLFIGSYLLSEHKRFFLAIGFMDVMLFMLTDFSFYLYRISSYFLFYRVISLSSYELYYRESGNKAKIPLQYGLRVAVSIAFILFWTYFIVIRNSHATYPYIFMRE